jgi:hypothetical protein
VSFTFLAHRVDALDEALARFGRPEIFNTDQGSQFTSAAFTGRLASAGIRVMCVKFSKMVLVADVVAPVGNAVALSTGVVHAALRSASFLSSRR